jgi:hypothetical protein
MVNPTLGQYHALEKRVLRLEKFITDNNEAWPNMDRMLDEDTLTDHIRDYVSQKFYVSTTSRLEQN